MRRTYCILLFSTLFLSMCVAQVDLMKTYFKAEEYKLSGEYDEALQEYMLCLSQDSTNASIWYNIAWIQFQNKDIQLAKQGVFRAISLEPSNMFFRDLYIDMLLSNIEYHQVREQIQYIFEQNVYDKKYFRLLLFIYEKTKDIKHIKLYNTYEVFVNMTEEEMLQKYTLLYTYKEIKDAEQTLLQLIKDYPNIQYSMNLLYMYFTQNMKKKMEALYTTIRQTYPKHIDVLTFGIGLCIQKEEVDSASKILEKLIYTEDYPIDKRVVVWSHYAPKLQKEDILRTGIFLYQTHNKHIEHTAFYLALFSTLIQHNMLKEAQDVLDRYLEIEPSNYNVYAEQVRLCQWLNAPSKLLKYVEKATEIFPRNDYMMLSKVWACVTLNMLDTAIQTIRQGLQYAQDISSKETYYYYLIDIYEKQQLPIQHIFAVYDTLLRISPENIIALNNYAYLLSTEKTNLEKAKAMIIKVNDIEKNNYIYQDTYAWVCFMLKEYKIAKKWIRKALKNGGGKDRDILKHAIEIEQVLGNTKRIKMYKNTLHAIQ